MGLPWSDTAAGTSAAGGRRRDYERRDYRAPFDFRFENRIDTRQPWKLAGADRLTGIIHITYSGDTNASGVPIVKHGDCTKDADSCSVGWELRGNP